MSYAQAKTALDALPAETRLAYATATVYTWRETYVTYRTLRAFFADRRDPDPKGRTDALAAAVAATDPLAHQMLLTSADGGGVDLARAESQQQIADLRAATLFASDDEVAALYDTTLYGRPGPARSNPQPRHVAEWQITTFDQSTLDRLGDWVAWEALSLIVNALLDDVDATLAYAAACPDAVVTYRASAPAALPALRDACVALVQDYRTKILAGTDVSVMPADAAGAWAKAKGA